MSEEDKKVLLQIVVECCKGNCRDCACKKECIRITRKELDY